MKTTKTYEELRARLDEMAYEIGIKSRPTPLPHDAQKEAKAYSDAFWAQMKTGEVTNDLRKGSDGSGGYLVPDEYDDRLVESLSESNVFRKIGKTIPTKERLRIPRADDRAEAQWVGENQPFVFGDMCFDETILDAYKIGFSILVTDELLEDSTFDLSSYLSRAISTAIGEAEEESFVKGNGQGKPLGIIYQAPVGAVSEEVGCIGIDDMMDLYHSVPKSYHNKSVWVMSEDAYAKLLRIRHYNGKPLWKNLYAQGEPVELFGRPIYRCKYLDKVSPGACPVLFGDFSYYWIGDRGNRIIKRLDERYAEKGIVGFIAHQRVDAKLVLPEAVKSLKIKE